LDFYYSNGLCNNSISKKIKTGAFLTFCIIIGLLFVIPLLNIGRYYSILYLPKLDEYSKNIGLIILTLSVTLFIEKQFSYGLDMHKDLFVFLGLMVNLPLIRADEK
jgi:hypothetical protein